jgi:acetyltransferase-like isoleucine patch superfamily enzyme
MKQFLKLLLKINLKTLYFNFKYLPFSQAIKMPVILSRKVYLLATSGKIVFEGPVKMGLIQIGFGNIGIFDKKRSRTIWEVNGKVVFKGKTNIGHGSKISVGKEGTLTLGENFTISAESTIVAFSQINFGNNCLLSWDILVMDTDFHKIIDESGEIINKPRPIMIGDKVWIGCRSLILKGTVIPDNCVIGANSTVSKPLEKQSCLYVGNPAKCVKETVTWEL